jgi:hypothetical protein
MLENNNGKLINLMERCLKWLFRLGYSHQSGPGWALITTTGSKVIDEDLTTITFHCIIAMVYKFIINKY